MTAQITASDTTSPPPRRPPTLPRVRSLQCASRLSVLGLVGMPVYEARGPGRGPLSPTLPSRPDGSYCRCQVGEERWGPQVCWHAAGPRESTGCPPATAGDGRRTRPRLPCPQPRPPRARLPARSRRAGLGHLVWVVCRGCSRRGHGHRAGPAVRKPREDPFRPCALPQLPQRGRVQVCGRGTCRGAGAARPRRRPGASGRTRGNASPRVVWEAGVPPSALLPQTLLPHSGSIPLRSSRSLYGPFGSPSH